MNLAYTDEERMLEDVARSFAEGELSFERVREYRDAPATVLDTIWAKLAELGLLGIDFDEADSGLGLGLSSLMIVQEALGATLAPTPMLSTILLSGQMLRQVGSAEQKAAWLPRIIAGKAVIGFAHFEPGMRFERGSVGCTLKQAGDTFVLNGTKTLVLDGAFADAFLVTAASGEGDEAGIGAVLIAADAKGVEVKPQRLLDGRSAALVEFSSVALSQAALVGVPGAVGAALEAVLDRATLALCAEMVGGMQRAFDMTVAYLREREQFGVKIGTFQALQHRAARMFISLSLARPTVRAAALAADNGDLVAFSKLVSLTKALCSDSYIHIANEAIQMHGGIGMTEEYPVGHYLRAAKVGEMLFGDASWHRARWASLHGY